MEMNKKGMFFTLMALGIISLMLVGFLGSHKLTNVKNTDVVEAKFNLINTHKKNIEDYASNVLYVQSKHAVADMLRYINETPTGTGIDNTDKRFAELVMNATLYGSSSNAPNMDGIGINNWTGKMDKRSTKFLRIESNMSITNPRLTQKSQWEVIALADIIINTSMENMSYNIKKTINTSFSIRGYEDPLYLYEGESNKINITSVYRFSEDNTYTMLVNRTYRHTGLGPSFIMRMEQDYSNSSCCGIQSLIDNSLVTSPSHYDRSFVDYLYWGGKRNCTSGSEPLYNFTTLSYTSEGYGFKLDEFYMKIYGMNITNTPGEPYCTP